MAKSLLDMSPTDGMVPDVAEVQEVIRSFGFTTSSQSRVVAAAVVKLLAERGLEAGNCYTLDTGA